MPTYCYEDKRGNVHERDFSMGKAPRSIKVEAWYARDRFLLSSCRPYSRAPATPLPAMPPVSTLIRLEICARISARRESLRK